VYFTEILWEILLYDLLQVYCIAEIFHFVLLCLISDEQQQMLADKPDIMSEIPTDSSERSFAMKIEMGCCVVLRLANEHRQEFAAMF